jgi:WD40 repeat protein
MYEYFEKIQNKVHIREAELIESIKTYFDGVLGQIVEIRDRFQPASQDRFESVVSFKNENLEEFETEISALVNENKEIQTSCSKFLDLDKKLKENRKRVEEIEGIFDKKLDDLLQNTSYELSPLEKLDYARLFGKLVIKTKILKPKIDLGTCLRTLTGHSETVSSLLVTDKNELISGSCDKRIKVWCLQTGKCLKTIQSNQKAIYALALSKKGQLASGSANNVIKVWDIDSGACIQTLRGHEDYTNALVFDESSGLLISGSNDSTIKIWDIGTGRCLKTLLGHTNDVYTKNV